MPDNVPPERYIVNLKRMLGKTVSEIADEAAMHQTVAEAALARVDELETELADLRLALTATPEQKEKSRDEPHSH